MLGRLMPREGRFFDLFNEHAAQIVDAGKEMAALMADFSDFERHAAAIDRIEKEGDHTTHRTIDMLRRTFITPLDREDIHMLASRLDDVLDRIDGAARRTAIFRAESAPQGANVLADVIVRATEQLLVAVQVLEKGKSGVVIKACIEVKRLEEEGDSAYAEWLGRLFDQEKDPIALIKWKEIYDTLEKTLDQAEDVANILESIAIKHS
jgi:predicted phosphate transport protein (TIGR00153 family)